MLQRLATRMPIALGPYLVSRLALTGIFVVPALLPIATEAAIIEDFPDAIICSVKDPTGFLPWEELVFYVSAHTRDGETLYKTLTSDPVVIIVSSEGVLNAANLADCDGRSVEDLLDVGRAFFLTPNSSESRPRR